MTQSEILEGLMRAQWVGLLDDEPDVVDTDDARDIASVMGAKPCGQPQGTESGVEWLFPDGSTVFILNDGSGTASVLP